MAAGKPAASYAPGLLCAENALKSLDHPWLEFGDAAGDDAAGGVFVAAAAERFGDAPDIHPGAGAKGDCAIFGAFLADYHDGLNAVHRLEELKQDVGIPTFVAVTAGFLVFFRRNDKFPVKVGFSPEQYVAD